MIRTIVAGGLMAASVSIASASSQVEVLSAVDVPDYIPQVRAQLDRVVEDDRVVGLAAAVIENGEPVLVYTHGQVAAGVSEAVAPDTMFRAASVSKTFTGTLLAMLEAGSGITTLPRLAFPINNDKLCFVPLSEPKLVRKIGIIKQASRSLSPSAQALEKMIHAELAGMAIS